MDERIEILARRARRLRGKGEFRKAANTYGELTSVEPERATWWVLLASMLYRVHRAELAMKAYRQALFLFRRAGETSRERTVKQLLARIAEGPAVAA